MSAQVFDRDFDRLEEGARFASRGRTITESDLVSFSALTGDWHPQHADADWAAASQFGERIAHGMLVLSYAIGLLPIDPDRVVALRGIRGVIFKRPVPIGDDDPRRGRGRRDRARSTTGTASSSSRCGSATPPASCSRGRRSTPSGAATRPPVASNGARPAAAADAGGTRAEPGADLDGARREAAADHRRDHPPQHRVRGRARGAARGRRGRADRVRRDRGG